MMPGGNTALIIASLALGMAGAFADLAVPTPALVLPKRVCGVQVPPFHLDDNFVVPIVSGYACTKVFAFLGWSTSLQLARYILF
jgi:dolichol kinase